MSKLNNTNLQRILEPSWKRKNRIIFNPIFKDSDDLEEINKLISIKMQKLWMYN